MKLDTMTTLREAAEMALEVMENLDVYGEYTKNATVRELRKVLSETQRKPMRDEEIDRITDAQWATNNNKPIYAAHRAYARAIERAHGIGGEE